MKQMTILINKQNFANIMVIFLLCISSETTVVNHCNLIVLCSDSLEWDEFLDHDKTNFHHSLAIIVNCHQLRYNNRRTFV